MSNVKTGSKKVFWGRMNAATGVGVGNKHKDVTSEFFNIAVQVFKKNTINKIHDEDGKVEVVLLAVDEDMLDVMVEIMEKTKVATIGGGTNE